MSPHEFKTFPIFNGGSAYNTKLKTQSTKGNFGYYLTLTLLVFLFAASFIIMIAIILEFIEKEQKADRLRLRQKLIQNNRKPYIKTNFVNTKLDRLLARSEREIETLNKEFDLHRSTILEGQLRSIDVKTALLLIIIVGEFIRVVTYGTEIFLLQRGSGALVGSFAEGDNRFTIP